jgi:hypothetical protein
MGAKSIVPPKPRLRTVRCRPKARACLTIALLFGGNALLLWLGLRREGFGTSGLALVVVLGGVALVAAMLSAGFRLKERPRDVQVGVPHDWWEPPVIYAHSKTRGLDSANLKASPSEPARH